MAIDFQIVFPQEAIKINAARLLTGITPAMLDIVGEDFSSVDEVLINEIASPQYTILSPKRLVAVLPSTVTTVSTVAVTSRQLTLTEKSFLRFRIGRSASKVSGILRLVQLFVKLLFTTAGTDIFNQRVGSSGLRNLGKTFSHTESGAITSDFVVSVQTTERQLIMLQGRQPSLPPDERLLSARVVSSYFSADDAALLVGVEITSQAGRAATAQVVV